MFIIYIIHGLIKKNFIFENVKKLKGVGVNFQSILKKKNRKNKRYNIKFTIFSETDRSKIIKLNQLEIGKIQTIKVLVKKLIFLELEIYLIRFFVRMKLEKLKLFILIAEKDI